MENEDSSPTTPKMDRRFSGARRFASMPSARHPRERRSHLREKKYLKGKPDSEKATHHEQRRVGWQESSPQNNFRRIIAAPIPQGEYCNHKINYVPEGDSALSLDFVLAILNSRLGDWFFRLTSTNAAVSHYQIYRLPAPTLVPAEEVTGLEAPRRAKKWPELAEILAKSCPNPGVMPESVAECIAEMSREIQKSEANRVLQNRSERSRLAPESQVIQDAIDQVLFRCFGLTDAEGAYIEKRLKEML